MRSIAGVSPALHWLRRPAEEADYLLVAEVKALNWQQEFEADEVAELVAGGWRQACR